MNKKYYISINLSNDKKIQLCLETKYAPITVENFIKLVKEDFYNGTIFHRIIKDFMIQTGGYYIEDNCLKELKEVETIIGEFKSNGFNNELMHDFGVISMARTSDKNSASGQFFICANSCSWLDGEYAAFGTTINQESLDVINEISNYKTGVLGPGFQDFPYELISIKNIVIDQEIVEN